MKVNNENEESTYTKIFQEKLKHTEDLKNKSDILSNNNEKQNINKEQIIVGSKVQENKNELENKKGINFEDLSDWETQNKDIEKENIIKKNENDKVENIDEVLDKNNNENEEKNENKDDLMSDIHSIESSHREVFIQDIILKIK